ncbi:MULTISPECIES: HNH endonuclease [unclassified Microbacterium]|uniref:HNH endonuclease n=1 Tax=unclassified Microbacterium TaxID=2609290 RepID=UPI00300FFC67
MNAYRAENADVVNARKREYRAKHPERVRESSSRAYEARREYYQQRAREWYAQNTEQASEAAARWVQQNREAVRAIKSRHKHKRRALEAESVFRMRARDFNGLLRRADGRCVYCRVRFSDEIPVTWDHIVPVVRGGAFSIGNLTPACGSCNSSKGARTITEWRMSRARVARVDLSSLTIL